MNVTAGNSIYFTSNSTDLTAVTAPEFRDQWCHLIYDSEIFIWLGKLCHIFCVRRIGGEKLGLLTMPIP
jgi:hypothetical protein